MTTQLKARRSGPAAQPVRAVRLGPREVVAERRGDGSILLRSPHALPAYPAKLTERLEHWATAAPARTFLAQRAALGWRKLGYGDTLDQVRRLGAALLRRDLSRERPLVILSQLAFFADEPPIIVDWAPWHHTAGGNHNFGFVLYNGGTLYIDEGKPVPSAIETTVKNLREVATNWYFTVPKGYEALLPYFRTDAGLRKTFFRELKVLWFAGAALSQSVFDEMQELALAACGERIMFLTGLGATETAPMAIARMWQSKDSTNMGVPVPGVELKLVPSHGKLEARVRGPNVTPGYWRQDELTAQAFDEEGFYKLGDALKFEDPADPRAGLLFDGRVAEDFKLATGTWVNVGPLRARLLQALEPYARDVVIAGADRNEIGALIFPSVEACRKLPAGADVASDARLREELRARLTAFASTSTGSSNRVCRAILLAEPPSLDAGEMTDKGSINQRAVLERRADLVAELYALAPSPRVLVIDKGP